MGGRAEALVSHDFFLEGFAANRISHLDGKADSED